MNELTTAILIALTACQLVIANPVYAFILYKMKMQKKPFTCVLCMSFWLGLVITYMMSLNWLVPFAASFMGVLLEKWYKSLPTKL